MNRLFILLLFAFACFCTACKTETKPAPLNTGADPAMSEPALKNPLDYLIKDNPRIDTAKNIFVTVIHPDDCITCYAIVEKIFKETISARNIPSANIAVITPKTRKVEREKLFKHTCFLPEIGTYINYNSDSVAEAFIKESGLGFFSSIYIIFSPSGKIIEAKYYKGLN